jgi:uncharacterized membrane protein
MKPMRFSTGRGIVGALLLSTLLCMLFYAYRLSQLREIAFSYLPWNLFLAWIPLLLIVLLLRTLRRHAWSDWLPLLLTLLWLLFLPNSFYLVSDYIHLRDIPATDILYDSVMFTMFVFTGLLVGFCSLYLLHLELLKRLPVRTAAWWVGGILLACSAAIYIGRDLRWNSWDVLASPAGLLFDLSSRLVQTSSWQDFAMTVAIFFALLGGMYYVGWQLMRARTRLARGDS